jgi:hypothetical protein
VQVIDLVLEGARGQFRCLTLEHVSLEIVARTVTRAERSTSP